MTCLRATREAEHEQGEFTPDLFADFNGLPDDEYLTVFGQYIIKPQLFDYLEEHINNNVRERGEFQLTSALDRLRKEDGFLGLMIDGNRFDIGLPEYYLRTLNDYAK